MSSSNRISDGTGSTCEPTLCTLILVSLFLWEASLRAQPTITVPPTNQTVWTGSQVTLTVAVSGTGPFTYQWQHNGTNVPKAIITTVAGGVIGDGGAAASANLWAPYSTAIDASGRLFIADTANHRIRQVRPDGAITTVAGNGTGAYSGDGGAATNASLNNPTGVVLDAYGNLFIADEYNNRVRKVDTNGIITTVAGNGSRSYSGNGVAATNASLNYPISVSVDAIGNLFIADFGNNIVRKVDTNGIITTVAGNRNWGDYTGEGGQATNATVSNPCCVVVDAIGHLFIANTVANRVCRVNTNGIITTVAGNGQTAYSGDGGAATNATLNNPTGVAVDGLGNLFIADHLHNRIRQVNTNGIISTVAGNGMQGYLGDGGASTNAAFNNPTGVTVDLSGTLFITDQNNNLIRRVTNDGVVTTVAGQPFLGDGRAALNAWLYVPTGVTLDAWGNVFLVDRFNQRVRKMSPDGLITTVAGNGTAKYSGDGGAATNASLNYPYSVAVDSQGNVFIADVNNNRIRRVSTSGVITTVAGNGTASYSGDGGAATDATLNKPSGVLFDTSGNLFIADSGNNRIRQVAPNGLITTVAGNGAASYSGDGGAATNASLNNPSGMALDATGNLLIADFSNQRIRRVGIDGVITTVAGNGTATYSGDGGAATNASLYSPVGLAVDGLGNVFIADDNNNRIRQVDTNGIITSVAGNGVAGYTGDGGAATAAGLRFPQGVAIDTAGNLLIADAANNRIRKVILVQGPTFALNNMSESDSGDYSVVITGSGGSVTSSIVSVRVTSAPLIYQVTPDFSGNVTLSFVNQPGSTNILFYATNITPPVLWEPLSTNVAHADGNWQYTDTNTAISRVKFFRFQRQ